MKIIVTVFLAALLSSCNPETPQRFDFTKADIGTLPGCPTLPDVDNMVITGESGVDFRSCKAIHAPSGKVLFEIYVGEHPYTPDGGLKFGGTTTVNGKTLIWFNTAHDAGSPRIWHTYLPTGSPRGTVMVATFPTNSPSQLDNIATLIAHLTPSQQLETQ